jgi:signal transduction histidine kinase
MSFFRSLRWRIQMWHGLLLLAVVAGFCALTYRLQSANVRRQADSELKFRLDALVRALAQSGPRDNSRPPPPAQPPDFATAELSRLFPPQGGAPFYFALWSRTGPMLTRSPGCPADVPRPARTDAGGLRTRANLREAYLHTPPGECLLVGRSLTPVEEDLGRFARWLAAGGAGVLALGLAGGWWFSTRALRPVDDIEQAATLVARGQLTTRIPVRDAGSELGHLAVTLNETFARLDASFARQARFTSDAAHELRTPLSLILAQAQLALARPRSTSEYREAIETTQRAARRMHALVESLLELDQLDASAEPLALQPGDLATLAREQLEFLSPLAAERRIAVRADLAPAPCVMDPGRAAQILANLLDNAVKFSPPDSLVSVATRGEPGAAIATVTDHGPGIATRHLPHIFERFYRADASRSRTTGGSGLGLSICRRIAEAHGGSITVESKPGEGCRFTLRIPTTPCAPGRA